MEPRMSRFLHEKAARLGLPFNGTFELTARCNFNCPMCYVHLTTEEQRRRGRELTGTEWIDIAEQAKAAGTVYLLLTGGEPAVHPDFPAIYERISQMGFTFTVNSNGRLLDGALLDLIKKNPPFRFNITLYGLSNEDYEKQCGVPAYDSVVRNIQALRDAGIPVRINLTLIPSNYRELPELMERAKALGAHIQGGTYMFPPINTGRDLSKLNYRLPPEEAARGQIAFEKMRIGEEQFRSYAARVLRDIPSDAVEKEPAAEGNQMQCRAGRCVYWINWQGNMTPCAQMSFPVGNVLDLGLKKAWEIVHGETPAIRLPKECRSCRYAPACHICAAKTWAESEAFDQRPYYICKMTKAFVELLREEYGGNVIDEN